MESIGLREAVVNRPLASLWFGPNGLPCSRLWPIGPARSACHLTTRLNDVNRRKSQTQITRIWLTLCWDKPLMTLSGLFFHPIFTTPRQHSPYPYV